MGERSDPGRLVRAAWADPEPTDTGDREPVEIEVAGTPDGPDDDVSWFDDHIGLALTLLATLLAVTALMIFAFALAPR